MNTVADEKMGYKSTRESVVDKDTVKLSGVVFSTASSSVMTIVVHRLSPPELPLGKVRVRKDNDV